MREYNKWYDKLHHIEPETLTTEESIGIQDHNHTIFLYHYFDWSEDDYKYCVVFDDNIVCECDDYNECYTTYLAVMNTLFILYKL